MLSVFKRILARKNQNRLNFGSHKIVWFSLK